MFTKMKSIAVYGKFSMAGNPIQSLNVCKWSRFLGVAVIFMFLVLDWNWLGNEANAVSLFKCK